MITRGCHGQDDHACAQHSSYAVCAQCPIISTAKDVCDVTRLLLQDPRTDLGVFNKHGETAKKFALESEDLNMRSIFEEFDTVFRSAFSR